MTDANHHSRPPGRRLAADSATPKPKSGGVIRRLRLRVGAPLIAVVCLVAACATAGPAAAGGVPKNFYGVVPISTLDSGDFARMGAARVGSLRIQMLWPFIQSARNGPFDWSSTDPLVAGAASQHISLLPTLLGTPNFVLPGTSFSRIQVGTQTQRNEWKSFVRAVVQRYGPHGAFWKLHPELPYDPVTRWQIWNEQNNPIQKNGPKAYAKLLKLSDQAISSVDKKGQVITGGMFGSPPHKKHQKGVTAWSYLDLLYKHGVGKHLDGVGLHPYAKDIPALKAPIKKIRGVLKRHHRGSVKLLITEIGWGSSKKVHPGTGSRGAVFNVGVKKQKENLTKSFKVLTKHRKGWKIGGVFWFDWKDPAGAPPGLCAFCYSSGLYEGDGTTPKPALSAYKHFTRKTR
jgi:hypothetical protein